MTWHVYCGHFWSYCLKSHSHSHMSKIKGQQVKSTVRSHSNSYYRTWHPPNCTKIKNSIIFQILFAVYMLYPSPFISWVGNSSYTSCQMSSAVPMVLSWSLLVLSCLMMTRYYFIYIGSQSCINLQWNIASLLVPVRERSLSMTGVGAEDFFQNKKKFQAPRPKCVVGLKPQHWLWQKMSYPT